MPFSETPILTRRDRLLLCRSRVQILASDARTGMRTAKSTESRELWAAIEQLATCIETLSTLELRRPS